LISQDLLNLGQNWYSWVSVGGNSDHLPILLKIEYHGQKPPSPLKLNEAWLKEEEYVNLIKNSWTPLNGEENSSFMHQFPVIFPK
jgi:hypothetical protein